MLIDSHPLFYWKDPLLGHGVDGFAVLLASLVAIPDFCGQRSTYGVLGGQSREVLVAQ
jgi:hypothetical protein